MTKKYGPWTSDNYGEYHITSEFCPYGQVGDRLYVRETWAETRIAQDINLTLIPVYKACDNTTDYGGPWKPSIHMPKKYARIWLEITDICVERVNDITEASAWKEGFTSTVELTPR